MIVELQNAVRNIFRAAPEAAQGVSQPCLKSSSLVIAILILIVVPAPASAQTIPEAPAMCDETMDDCGSSVGDNTNGKKWNPGHYLRTQGNHAQADTAKYLSSVTAQLSKTGDSPEIKGAHVLYAWGVLEPSLGKYDWEPIYTHLNYLSSRGKKLILTVQTKCFSKDCTNLAPSDLASEVYVTPKDPPTLIIETWEERNMDLYIALMQAMAAEFDDNPALEMILGAESAPSLKGSTPTNFSKDIFATQLKRMYSAQAAAFKNTNVVANVNFLTNQVSDLVEHAFKVGIGRGLPDIIDSTGSVVFRGECAAKDCGVRDYRELIPHFGVVSTPTLTGRHGPDTDSPAKVIAYGMTNKFTHYAWVSNESGEDSLANIINEIENTSGSVFLGCPTVYQQGCKSGQ